VRPRNGSASQPQTAKAEAVVNQAPKTSGKSFQARGSQHPSVRPGFHDLPPALTAMHSRPVDQSGFDAAENTPPPPPPVVTKRMDQRAIRQALMPLPIGGIFAVSRAGTPPAQAHSLAPGGKLSLSLFPLILLPWTGTCASPGNSDTR